MTEHAQSVRGAEADAAAPIAIVPMRSAHWDAVRAIYEQGIATGNATLETSVPDWDAWDHEHLAAPRLVALVGDSVAGWAALSPVSGRCVYGGVAEVSVYIGDGWRGRGIGLRLLQELVEQSEANGIWTLQAGILPENTASLTLHERAGFRRIGVRERLGKLNGAWRDVVLLERRSRRVGID